MATQATEATISIGPGYRTLEIDGVEFPYITSDVNVQTHPDNPEIDSVVVTIPLLGKVQYE
jgi:hypothetical protein